MSPRNTTTGGRSTEAWKPGRPRNPGATLETVCTSHFVILLRGRYEWQNIQCKHSFDLPFVVFSILFQLTFPFFHVVCCFVLSFFLCGKKFLIYPLLPHRPPHPKEYQPPRGFNHVPWILSHLDDMVAIFCRHASLGFLLSLAPSTP